MANSDDVEIIYSWEDFERWIICKEAFILKRRFLTMLNDIFPLAIYKWKIRNVSTDIDLFSKNILLKYIICELEDEEDRYLFEKLGFIYICDSKDDLPIMIKTFI